MSGRYSLTTTELDKDWNTVKELEFKTSYNIAPLATVPVVIKDKSDNLKLVEMKWGFQFTTKDGSEHRVINAKGETLLDKKLFKKPALESRCLIPATGFYEWEKTAQGKIPHYISLKEAGVMYFGGIFRTEKHGNAFVSSCVIITALPNTIMERIHRRMPFIVPKTLHSSWLDADNQDVLKSIAPYPDHLMFSRTVSKDVNKPSNDGVELISEYMHNK